VVGRFLLILEFVAVFVAHRYAPLFATPAARVLASAVAFGMAHVILQNWIAPTFSLVGGALFAWTYERTGSGLVAAVQHAAFGCTLFTLGLGWYFYYGSLG
jgi:membrane protease YdiL (CAAX protease family)